MRRISLVLTIICAWSFLIFSSCGRPFKNSFNSKIEGFTTIHFEGSQSHQLFDLTNLLRDPTENKIVGVLTAPNSEAIVYASKLNEPSHMGRRYFSGAQLSGSSSKNWTIPNGQYFFSMIGYSSFSGGNQGGFASAQAPICALGSEAGLTAGDAITLDGTNKTIALHGSSCNSTGGFLNSVFKDGNDYPGFVIRVCDEDISTKPNGAACSNDATASTIRSVRLYVHEKDHFINVDYNGFGTSTSGNLTSACLNFSSGSSPLIKYLAGSTNSSLIGKVRLPVEIALFTDSFCNDSNFHSFYIFDKGIAQATGSASGSEIRTIFPLGGTPTLNESFAKWTDGISGSFGVLFLRRVQ